MTNDDMQGFTTLIADASSMYGQQISPFSIGVWWAACRPYSLPQVRKALTAHALDPERGHFAPKPADIVRQLKGTGRDDALLAWQRVLGQASSVGRYGTPTLSEPERVALSAIGGWQRLCNSDESELSYLQKNFTENYAAFSVAEGRQQIASPEVERIAGEAIRRIAAGAADE